MERDMNQYLDSLKTTQVRTLKELVEWNTQHAEEALPAGKHY
jgi:hypothetical protein